MRRSALCLQNPCRQNPLALAGRQKRARAFTPNTGLSKINTAARDVVPDDPEATIWRDSGARVCVLASTCSVAKALRCDFFASRKLAGAACQRVSDRLTAIAAGIECLSRAAPKRRHVSFGTFCSFVLVDLSCWLSMRTRQCAHQSRA